MNTSAIGWRAAMNKPERLELRGVPGNVEVVHQGGSIVLRRIVAVKKFRAAADAVIAHMPAPRKGASVRRELKKTRLRVGG
jgi:hypothetical protein